MNGEQSSDKTALMLSRGAYKQYNPLFHVAT
jgi:hypothetical protein